jgi:hypothetical protein
MRRAESESQAARPHTSGNRPQAVTARWAGSPWAFYSRIPPPSPLPPPPHPNIPQCWSNGDKEYRERLVWSQQNDTGGEKEITTVFTVTYLANNIRHSQHKKLKFPLSITKLIPWHLHIGQGKRRVVKKTLKSFTGMKWIENSGGENKLTVTFKMYQIAKLVQSDQNLSLVQNTLNCSTSSTKPKLCDLC